MQRRETAEEHSGQQGERCGESQHRQAERNRLRRGELCCRRYATVRSSAAACSRWRAMIPATAPRDDSTRLSARNCRSSRARVAPSAVRTSNLPLAIAGSNQQEVGDVRAGNEQHQRDRGKQRQQGRTELPDERIAQRSNPHANRTIGRGIALRQTGGDRIQLDAGLLRA